ncbi:hypothetical protein ACFSCX_06335 [Bacillus salitolerans]|uniref:YrzO family protein n=1 Tax=Bacillus salitolerans TaxID=1437434 RepID=A0ABW4LQ02_9BACI
MDIIMEIVIGFIFIVYGPVIMEKGQKIHRKVKERTSRFIAKVKGKWKKK